MTDEKTLDEYFTALRASHGISEDAVRGMVDAAANEGATPLRKRRGIVAAGVTLVVMMIAATAIVGVQHDRKPPTAATPRHEAATITHGDGPLMQTHPTSADTDPIIDREEATAAMTQPSEAEVTTKRTAGPSDEPRAVPVTVAGVRMIELTREELAQIGVELAPDGSIRCYSKGYTISNRYPDSLYLTFSRLVVSDDPTVRTDEVAEADMPEGIIIAGLPRLITDTRGYRRLVQDWSLQHGIADSTRRFLDSLHALRFTRSYPVDNLIPILISGAQRGGSTSHSDVILWFDPSPRLVQQFPPCLRDALRAEYAELMERKGSDFFDRFREKLSDRRRQIFDSLRALDGSNIEIPCPDAGSRAIVGEPYLDVWRSASGAIVATAVSPNPAHDVARLRYQLNAARTVSVRLHDLRGGRIRTLMTDEAASEGAWELELSLDDIRPGLYLVVLTTDHGEQGVQRLVVE